MNQMRLDDDTYWLLSLAMELVIRTHQPAQTLLPAVHRIFAEVAPGMSIDHIQTYRQKIDDQLGSQSLAARLLWMFAIAAVLISAAGLYGLLSYSVAQRTREIGVRIALGAQREDILRHILRQAGRLVTAGVAIGLLCAFFLGRFIRSFLYGVNQHDAVSLLVVAMILGFVGLIAAYIPARRASRIEPTEALRTE
jgi:ABC-type antimicrobial peptide transport system permease subunit